MGSNIQTFKDIRQLLSLELSNIYEEEEIISIANILIRTATGLSRLHEIYNNEQTVTEIQAQKIIRFSKELASGKPLQYVLGETEFYGCKIKLNGETLIPRPETEELTDLVIKENRSFNGSIIDLGTGSGCIAIALSKNMPGAKILGVDISEEALKIAELNNALNNANAKFARADLLDPDSFNSLAADIIVSNPPYVRTSEKAFMKSNVLDYEPHRALFVPDSDPLLFYKAIIKISHVTLVAGGYVYLEINEAFGEEMTMLFQSSRFKDISVIKDLNGRNRILKARKNG